MSSGRGRGAALTPGLAAALPLLCCPVCGATLAAVGVAVRCRAGHSFDLARQGYVSLLPGDARTGTADDARMVQARQEFLAAGHHDRLMARIAACAAAAVEPKGVEPKGDGCVVDAGAGTGRQLAEVLIRLPGRAGIALDLSKHALRRAARAHPRIAAVAADTWHGLPLRDGVADVLLCVFAPRNPAEFRRVLSPAGALVVATPTPAHLAEAVARLGLISIDPDKVARLDAQLSAGFTLVEESVHEERWVLDRAGMLALVAMGPSARHIEAAEVRRRVEALPEPFRVSCSVRVSRYRPAGGGTFDTPPPTG